MPLNKMLYSDIALRKVLHSEENSQQTQNICITFVQCWANVEDVGPALYKCYTKTSKRHSNHCFVQNELHLYNICTMLGWASVVQMLYKCFVFVGKRIPGNDNVMYIIQLQNVSKKKPFSRRHSISSLRYIC